MASNVVFFLAIFASAVGARAAPPSPKGPSLEDHKNAKAREEDAKRAWLAKLDVPAWGAAAKAVTSGGDKAAAAKPKGWWSSAEFWGGCGALAGWGMTGSAIYDASFAGPEVISLTMTPVMIVYSSLFARWAFVVKPQNLLLSACHVSNVVAQLNQMRRAIEHKLANGEQAAVNEIGMKSAAFAVTVGGLCAGARLVMEGVEVLAFSADLGQPDETDINNVKKRMATCGVETVIIDLKDEMAEGCFDIIQAQAKYDGGYWNTTGIGRFVTCYGLVTAMAKKNVQVLSHGATGRGNDQMRFERYTNVLAPKMLVYAPWRDPELLKEFPGRSEMVTYLSKFGIEAFVGPKKKYSTDANLAGLSHEAEDLESVQTPMLIVDPEMGVWPEKAPNKMEEIKMQFVGARCVAINGKKHADGGDEVGGGGERLGNEIHEIGRAHV